MEDTLVICIGNVARGDDGVAHEVARSLDGIGVTRVSATVALDVVHARDVAEARFVVFVDAQRRAVPLVEVRAIEAGAHPRAGTHGLKPEQLLALSRDLYGMVPEARLVAVAAPEMGHREGLSDLAREAAREAVEAVTALLAEATSGPASDAPPEA